MARRGENIYKRKDGRWEGRYKIGVKPDGTSKYRSVYGKSYTAVKDMLALLKVQNNKEPISSGSLTVKALFDEWLNAIKNRVKPSTFENYRLKVDKHLLPEFGGMRYEMLSADMLHQFIQKKLNHGLSAKYVADIVTVFKSAARYASKLHGYRNPLDSVVLPKAEKEETVLLDTKQQKTLCRYLTSNMNLTALCVMLSLYTGLRVGEVCGLMWQGIDFEKSILTVNRTVQRIRTEHGTMLHIGSPKSRTSRRSIPIPAFLMEFLRKYRGQGDVYVLSGTNNVTEPRTLQRRFQSILKKADLPSQHYHCLRHIFATNCLQLGFDIKTLAELLGHSSPQTTLNRYLHTSMERKIECMRLLDSAA
jgi:Site-specific recombinase XerD